MFKNWEEKFFGTSNISTKFWRKLLKVWRKFGENIVERNEKIMGENWRILKKKIRRNFVTIYMYQNLERNLCKIYEKLWESMFINKENVKKTLAEVRRKLVENLKKFVYFLMKC